MTTFISKCETLSDFTIDYIQEHEDFIAQHDIGFPLAMLIIQGCATPTVAGIGFVEATYASLCDYLGVSKNVEWLSLEEMLS